MKRKAKTTVEDSNGYSSEEAEELVEEQVEESEEEEESDDEETEADESMTLEDINVDSDEELQEAFAAGLIKPGLNFMREVSKKERVNNVQGLEQKLSELKQNLPWIERLDMINKPAPLAPELAFRENQLSKEKGKSDDPVSNDFAREMLFYRQAQAAVLEAIPRLHSMNIKTKRPEDYYAQMAKSDQHMQKIREKLVSKQMTEERLEKIRKLRELRKFGKKVQIEVQQKRQKEKREMLEQVKKFKKGQADSIDFLDDDNNDKKKGKNKKGGASGPTMKRQHRDKKFGFGGKKRGIKANTKSSVNDTTSYRAPKGKKAGPKAKNMGQKLKNKRLGKNRRQNMKNRKK